MADLAAPIISAAAGLTGVTVGVVVQALTARASVNATRRHSLADFQRATLLELQDGPLSAAMDFVSDLFEWAQERPEALESHDLGDGADPIYQQLGRQIIRIQRLAVRLNDGELRALLADFEDELVAALRNAYSPSALRGAQVAFRAIDERIGELIRSDGT